MCEKTMARTEEQWQDYTANLLAGFSKWRAAKYGEPQKLTKEDFMKKYKNCQYCVIQGTCHKNNIGWHEEWAAEKEYRPLVNRPTHHGAYQSCCRWDGGTYEAILEALAEAQEKGEVE